MVMANPAIFLSMNAMQTLLRESIDYAGLFPPAGLDMRTAVENYARYAAGPSAWALGRFIVSVEVKATSERRVGEISAAVPSGWQTYIELPHAGDPRSLLQAVRDSGRRAKVRTGGVTP